MAVDLEGFQATAERFCSTLYYLPSVNIDTLLNHTQREVNL